jgi:hypothetical protein
LKRIDLVVPGYTFNPEASAEMLMRAIPKQKSRKGFLVDIFKEERKKWLFRKTLLTTSNHTSAIEVINKMEWLLTEIHSHKVRIGTLYTHSYGVVAILASSLDAEEYVLIAPPLEKVEWKRIEKLFWFLPGFKELRNGSLQEKLSEKLLFLKAEGKKVTIIISSLNEDGYGDERVSYSKEMVEGLSELAEIKIIKARHGQFMRDPDIVDLVCEA